MAITSDTYEPELADPTSTTFKNTASIYAAMVSLSKHLLRLYVEKLGIYRQRSVKIKTYSNFAPQYISW